MTTALYRRYRPETFAEVIGQDHVTGPLMQALRSGRVSHAYLFSGPRGCGKTTSARILARTLNCARNTPDKPLDTPCGECDSCRELARGGPGSLDVVEIDAASHNGVDDARDLRERATFAPARDRYKIFILDEAHMVTPQGFNALLKIVEEPPPHVKFVFATTEPDKVIGTIRSRTHHYPFRLVPPDVLGPYLEQLCAAEGIELGAGVVPLVTRAGGGSVRDSLSVLDQLIAGASGGVVEYDVAVGLLGFTHATLLDDVVDALAARDGASIFRVVDQVIASGHEPRRFVEDVLERLRDLIVIAVSGDAADAVLRGLPADQLERMRQQASRLGVSELSRAADLVNAALTEMTGATSPRLHLELLCARLLLPGADDGTAGLAARIDRLERGGVVAAVAAPGAAPRRDDDVTADAPAPAASGLSGAAAVRAALEAKRTATPAPAEVAREDAEVARPDAEVAREDTEVARPDVEVAPEGAEVAHHDAEVAREGAEVAPEPAATATPPAPSEPAPSEPAPSEPETTAGVTAEVVRRRWDEVVANIGSPVTRALVGPNAQVISLEAGLLRLGFTAAGMARTFSQPRHIDAVAESVYQTLGVQVRVEATIDEGRGDSSGGPAGGGGAGVPGPSAPAGPGGSSAASPESGAPATSPGVTARPADTDDGGWPAVTPPGSAARSAASPASAIAPVGRPEAGARVGAVDAPRSAVALAERPGAPADEAAPEPEAVSTPPAPEPEPEVAPAPGAAAPSAADDADAAWLAGVPLSEPPEPDDAPEPPPEDVAPSWSAPRPTAARTPGPQVRETPRQAAERQAREYRAQAQAPAPTADDHPAVDYDEPSADDPDIASTGLVGVPLVVQVLDGKVIDEITEDPA
ncbi:DNA polymerase III subunit gamma and tau [Isoptericola variabilis]|uniref:DNA polymerase III subunit gamma and tau n=1 Tax=Isoptericola variabilis TaxID=139208 RepID=UPI00059C40C2